MKTKLLALLLLGLAACSTVEGLGEDIQSGGEALSGAARQTEEKL